MNVPSYDDISVFVQLPKHETVALGRITVNAQVEFAFPHVLASAISRGPGIEAKGLTRNNRIGRPRETQR